MLHDWKTIFAYVDKYSQMSQGNIVEYFKTWAEEALLFTQPTLSRKLDQWEQLEEHATFFPNALAIKWPHIIIHPDIEKAVYLWVRSFEDDSEIIEKIQKDAKAEKNGDDDMDQSDDEGDDAPMNIMRSETILMTEKLEKTAMLHADSEFSLDLLHQLCLFRAKLKHDDMENKKQVMLDRFFRV